MESCKYCSAQKLTPTRKPKTTGQGQKRNLRSTNHKANGGTEKKSGGGIISRARRAKHGKLLPEKEDKDQSEKMVELREKLWGKNL